MPKSKPLSEGFSRYLYNTSWLIAERVFRMVLGLVTAVAVARVLGPDKFGLLSYAQSIILLFSMFASVGLDAVVVREIVKDNSKTNLLMGTAFAIKLAGVLLIAPLLAAAIQFSSADSETRRLIYVFYLAYFFQCFDVIDFYFQSKVVSKLAAIARAMGFTVLSFGKLAFLALGMPLLAFAIIAVIETMIVAAGLIYFYRRYCDGRLIAWQFDRALAKQLLKSSLPLAFSGLVVSIYMRADQIMIKEMLDAAAVGQYVAAVQLSEAWYFIPTVIASSVFPAIIEARELHAEVYRLRLRQLYSTLVCLAFLVAIPATVLADPMVSILYGAAFEGTGSVLTVHIWSGVFVFLAVASGKYMTLEGWETKILKRHVLGATLNIGLNLLAIPRYGGVGAALATLLSWLAAAYLYDAFDKTLRENFVLKTRALFLIDAYFLLSEIRNKRNE